MKKTLLALASLCACSFALAQDAAVDAAKSANEAFVSCVQAVTEAAAQMKNETVQAMMIDKAPDNCSKNVRVAQVKAEPSTAHYVWDGVKFGLGLWAGYKQQSLMFGAITGIVDRMSSSNDASVTQGFNTANNGLAVTGNLAGQAINKLPAPVWPTAVHTPAATPAPDYLGN